jgi:hypothetical protein
MSRNTSYSCYYYYYVHDYTKPCLPCVLQCTAALYG